MNETHSCVIYTLGAPILSKKAKKVTTFDPQLKKLAEDMLVCMNVAQGIGLAAPQFGLPMQLVVIDLQRPSQDTILLDEREIPMNLLFPFSFTNPRYTPLTDLQEVDEEGCLSVPGVRGYVKRYYEICLNYQDLDGTPHQLKCRDLLARCIQHECDHLQGILFVDRLSKTERRELKASLDHIKQFGGQVTYHIEQDD